MKLTLVYSILVTLVCLPAAPQQSSDAVLTGRVLAEAGTPIPGAQVLVEPGSISATTDRAGRFRIEGLPEGELTVTVVAEHYFPSDMHQLGVTAGEQFALEFELREKAIVQETVVVTGTGTEYLATEAPVRTELITTEMVESQVKTTLAEALTATIPGVRIETNCQNCGFTQLRMNGLEGPYTQILEDGLPNYSGVAAVYGLEQIPTAFVEQIEVVKGGNSALYGPGAVAGVVNLIRREPRENRFRIDTQAGWHRGRPEQQAGGAAQLADLPGEVSADLFYRGINRVQIDRDHDGFSDLPRRRLHSGGANLYRPFFDGTARLSGSVTVAGEFRRGGDRLHLPPHQTYITEQIESRRSTASVRWNHSLTPNTFYSLKSSYAHMYRDTYYGAQFDPNAYGFTRNPLWVTDAQMGHQRGRHSFLGGHQFWRDDVADVAPAYNRNLGGIFLNHGLYLQDEFRVSPRLMLLGGIRADKSNQIPNWVFSPRAGIRFGITQNLTWRLAVSTGFRAPGVFDEDLHLATVAGEGFLIESSPDLHEEKSLSFSTGLDYIGQAGGRRYELGVNFFSTRLSDNFQLAETDVVQGSFRQFLRVNGAGSYVRGIDFNGSFKLTPRFSLRGGATFQLARFDEPEDQFGSLRFFRTPNRYGFAGFDWDLPGGIEFLGTADFTGSMQVPHYAGVIPEDRLETSRTFSVFTLVVSKLFDVTDTATMRLFLNAGNITDDFQPDLDQGPFRDSNYVYGPGSMRLFQIGSTWEF